MAQTASQNGRHLGVFAKYWQPGAVKTRLAKSIGPVAAAALYREFVACLTHRLANIGDHRVLSYWPLERLDEFTAFGGDAWHVRPQADGTLGDRMAHFFRQRFESGASSAILIGSDSPTIRQATLDDAYSALAENDVVLGPALDGGYYLVGMSAAHVGIFEGIEWSTPAVWTQTVARIDRLGLRYFALPEFFDVDEHSDLGRLRRDILEVDEDGDSFHRLLTVLAQCLEVHAGNDTPDTTSTTGQ